jgi:hypothetical protein
MSERDQDRWLKDARASQRDIVFPDTVSTERRFWRNAITGKTRLTKVHIVGFVLIFVMVTMIWWGLIHERLKYLGGGLSVFQKFGLFADYAGLLALFAILFLVLRWRVRRALGSIEHSERENTRHIQ